jgi:hypothetical protein
MRRQIAELKVEAAQADNEDKDAAQLAVLSEPFHNVCFALTVLPSMNIGESQVASGFTKLLVCSISTTFRTGRLRQPFLSHRSHNPGRERCRSA